MQRATTGGVSFVFPSRTGLVNPADSSLHQAAFLGDCKGQELDSLLYFWSTMIDTLHDFAELGRLFLNTADWTDYPKVTGYSLKSTRMFEGI